uniref:Myb-like domain-containing protein n=1 Tax=Ditylenchus dipsaci TaxID=166011 RepID=A0A915E9B8_9BILA
MIQAPARTRHYRYSEEEEAEMMEFARNWHKRHWFCGPRAWHRFRETNPWARFLTADALRLKYVRLKRAAASQRQIQIANRAVI